MEENAQPVDRAGHLEFRRYRTQTDFIALNAASVVVVADALRRICLIRCNYVTINPY